ncbi:MAG: hypothetical protein DMF51_12400 [Acidobacteria bacterium]|nr:MAG: hypothetical protein DMF51_12400 [Acidobacteriota bacterium]
MSPGTRTITVFVTLVTAGLLTVAAVAAVPRALRYHSGLFSGYGSGGRLLHVLSGLDLTDDQKTQIKAILKDEGPRIEPLADQVIRTKKALFDAVHTQQFDEPAVRSAAATAASAETEMAVERARTVSRLRGLLTPDQQAQIETIRRGFEERIEKRIGLTRSIWREHAADFIDAL